MTASRYVVLKNKKMPWGDYGSILLSGMAIHRSPIGGRLQIERTGPFVPPIVDGGIWRFVVNRRMRALIETEHPDVRMRRCVKRKIARVDWHGWDLDAESPPFYPPGGEPEGYILDRWHDPWTSFAMGPIYQFDGTLLEFGEGDGVTEIAGLTTTSGKVVLVRDGFGSRTVFRSDFAEWLVDRAAGWVAVHPAFGWSVG